MLVGQIYLVTIVSLIVSNLGARRRWELLSGLGLRRCGGVLGAVHGRDHPARAADPANVKSESSVPAMSKSTVPTRSSVRPRSGRC